MYSKDNFHIDKINRIECLEFLDVNKWVTVTHTITVEREEVGKP